MAFVVVAVRCLAAAAAAAVVVVVVAAVAFLTGNESVDEIFVDWDCLSHY